MVSLQISPRLCHWVYGAVCVDGRRMPYASCGLLLFVMLYFCRRQSHMPSSEEAPLAALQAPPALVRGDVSYDTLPGKTDGNVGGRPPLQLAGWQGAGLIALGAPYFLLACALAAFGPMLGIH
eukprot:IDg14146t1